jgi:hypothetical protein
MDKEYAIVVLDGCDLFLNISISILIARSLVIIDEKNKFMINDFIWEERLSSKGHPTIRKL